MIDAKDKLPVAFATIAVYSETDTTLVGGSITAGDGNFMIEKIPKGKYVVRVSFVGYIPLLKNIEITDDRKPFEMKPIALQEGVELDKVEISGKLIPVSVRGDTVDYSAEAFRPIEGAMLEELLKRLPGIEVGKDGKITAHGKPVSQILVDGELFFTDNPQVAVQNIPADFVQNVQVYERKSDVAQFTGVDDGQEETVINLKLKPEMKMDWFGRLRLGAGVDAANNPTYANSANISSFKGSNQLMILGNLNNTNRFAGDNDRVDDGAGGRFETGGGDMMGTAKRLSPMINYVRKIDSTWLIRGSYRYKQDDERLVENIFREDILPDGSWYHQDDITRRDLYKTHNFNAEIKYMPNSNNEFSIQPKITVNARDFESHSIFEMKDDTLAVFNHGQNRTVFENPVTTAQLQLSYGHRFAKPKRTVRINLTGWLEQNNFTEYDYALQHFSVRPSDTLNQRLTDNSNRYHWNASVVYTEPLVRDFVLSLTYSVSSNESEDEKLQYMHNPFTDAYDLIDTMYSNNYGSSVFRQNMLVQIQKTAEKYHYSFGLGLIPSKTENRVEGLPDLSQDNLNLAPQARFRYLFSKSSGLDLRYFGTSRQPSVFELRRIPDNSNPLNISLGNSELKPEFSHQISVVFNNFSKRKHAINSSLSFTTTQNRIATSLIYDPSLFPDLQFDTSAFHLGARINRPENVGSAYRGNAYMSYGMPLFSEKMHVNASIRGSMSNSKGMVDKDINVMNSLSLTERLQITYQRDRFDIGLGGVFDMSNARYSLLSERNNTNYRNTVSTNLSWHIIKNKLTLSSDVAYEMLTGTYGYDYASTVWNAQLSYTLGKSNNAQLLLQIVDILNNRRQFWRDVSDNSITDMRFNTLRRFFLVSFIYSKKQDIKQ